ncbi:T9SS type A sorting domain-containing protein [Flavobacterium sangjuense]|uniref:Secretion system C-terminal sorting domain-containing protein n=1 Tax=Flavobacterium sangjuense TaxID=2518177 RepID=A0A4V1CBN4_9FLAO|nr:T9SS type A sorting domain-containing protein [Flavobacterium sangjuense]QBZ96594.1 hypothetical protein GS03_00067 [Flavobacterium sangjuense]
MKIFAHLFLTLKQRSVSSFGVIACLFFCILASDLAYAQPTVLGSSVANGSYTTYNLVTRGGGVRYVKVNATSAGTAGRLWEFATGVAGSANYTTNWRPYTASQQLSTNTYIDPATATSSARYNTSSGGATGTLPAVVSGSYYTFIVGGNSTANNFMSVLSTTYNPKDITAASQSPLAASVGVGQSVVVTATISAVLSTNETLYLRYSNDGFANSTIIPFSTSGTSLTATIPGAFNTPSANISYYIFSSNQATAPSVAQADYFTLNLYNASGQNVAGGGTNYTYTVGATTPTYTWNQTGTASWATGTNWTPTRTAGAYDNLVFNNGATTTVTNIPAEQIGALSVSGNTAVNLQAASANTLTIANGAAGFDLSVASGSALNANGASALNLALMTGATGSISGSMTFSTSVNTISPTDANSLTFNNGSKFTQTTGNTGAIFGTTGTANLVVFASGSTFEQNAGSSPFGLGQPASKVTFQTGSLFRITVNQAPGFTGRTYANFEWDANGSQSITGGTATSIDNFTITQGTFNLNMTAAPSIKGNISVANGAVLGFSPASVTAINLNGTGTQTITTTGTGTITVGANGNLTVASGSTVDMGTSFITGAGIFTVVSGATLKTANADGIYSSTATGSIRTTTRNFNTGANYVYNGTANQTTGTGLPATVNSLSINNTGTSPNNVVTLTNACTTGIVVLTAGKFDLNSKTFTVSTGGTITATNGDFTSTAGPVAFAGTAVVSGTVNFPTVTMAGGVNFGSASNIVTSLQLNSGGFVATNAPTYGPASTLIYNVTNYGRSLEWSTTSGAGYPNHVQVGNGTATTLDVNNSANAFRKMAGNLTVSSGSIFNINGITNDNGGNGICVEVVGDIINNGTINFTAATKRLKGTNFTNGVTTGITNLSSAVGGDLEVTGNFTDNNTFNANNRAVFFTGTGTQVVSDSASAPFNIDYIVSNKASGTIQLGVDLLTAGPNGGNAITLTGSSDVLDLNGKTLTLGVAGNSSTISGTGIFRGNSTSKMIINGTGAFGTVRFDQTTPGTSNLLSNFTLNRTSGSIVLGNDLNVSTDLTLTDGTIDLGSSNLTIGTAGTITVSGPSTTKMIIADGSGELRKLTTSNTQANFTFPIGDSTGSANNAQYTPVTTSASASSGATFTNAYIAAKVNDSKILSNNSQTNYLTRFWTVRQSGITAAPFTTTITGTYITGSSFDLNGGSGTDALISSAQLSGSFNQTNNPWIKYSALNAGTLTATGATLADGVDSVFTGITGANPTGTITGGGVSLCPGTANVNLGVTSVTGDSTIVYSWSPSTFLSSTTISNPVVVSPTSTVTYTLTIRDGNGISTTANTTITASTTTTTNGGVNWSDGTPSSTKAAIFDGSNASINTNFQACTLRLTNSAIVTVASNANVTLSGAITVDSGSTFTLHNNANLLQGGTANANTGNIKVERNTSELYRFDYTLWSTPVTGQELYAFSPYTASNRFYTYDTANDYYTAVSFGTFSGQVNGVGGTEANHVPFTTGKGYLIRVRYDWPTYVNPSTGTQWMGTFEGVPNNGNYTVGLSTDLNGYNAVGNPYPSAIDIATFLSNNSGVIDPKLWFWRRRNLSGAPAYITYTNGTFNNGPNNSLSPLDPQPADLIQSGQGFFVKANTAGALQFNNDQRVIGNGTFFKDSNVTDTIDVSRIWLNLSNTEGVIGSMALGYKTGATNGLDEDFDGEFINDSATSFALNSLVDATELSVQHRALPFDTVDVVPLSFKTNATGTYNISINAVDGLFADNMQPIYLKDDLTATYHDLNTGAYSFASEAGTFNDRFEIVYALPLGVDNPSFTPNAVVIYPQNNDLVVNSGNIIMSSIKIFDIQGRLLQDIKDINSSQTKISAGLSNEVLLVQITSDDGIVVTKKVIR